VERTNLEILIPQWYRLQTGTFLERSEEEKFNEGNKFLQLDKRKKKKQEMV